MTQLKPAKGVRVARLVKYTTFNLEVVDLNSGLIPLTPDVDLDLVEKVVLMTRKLGITLKSSPLDCKRWWTQCYG